MFWEKTVDHDRGLFALPPVIGTQHFSGQMNFHVHTFQDNFCSDDIFLSGGIVGHPDDMLRLSQRRPDNTARLYV